jgi:tRNA (guanine-N7-)-methyltransferase
LRRNFYGRFKGPPLSKAQETLLKVDLPRILIDSVDILDNPQRKLLSLDEYTGRKPLWLEIGFGSGEHLINQAICNPKIIFFGCEPYINGVVSLLRKIKEKNINNIFLYPGDARNLFDVLPNGSIDRVFLLYPDPWPKKRHNRRRFVNPEYLSPLFRVMKDCCQLRIATDITEYYRHACEEVLKFDFVLSNQNGPNFDFPWRDWFPTRYEQKAKKVKRRSYYLTFQKKTGV